MAVSLAVISASRGATERSHFSLLLFARLHLVLELFAVLVHGLFLLLVALVHELRELLLLGLPDDRLLVVALLLVGLLLLLLVDLFVQEVLQLRLAHLRLFLLAPLFFFERLFAQVLVALVLHVHLEVLALDVVDLLFGAA